MRRLGFEVFHLYTHLRYGWCVATEDAPQQDLTTFDRVMFILCFGPRSYREMEARNA